MIIIIIVTRAVGMRAKTPPPPPQPYFQKLTLNLLLGSDDPDYSISKWTPAGHLVSNPRKKEMFVKHVCPP